MAESRLKAVTERDPATGLWNRTRFRAELANRIVQGEPTAVVLADLDDFKRVNDAMGHATGDLFLQILGDRLATATDRWSLARLSGDQFAIAVAAEPADVPDIISQVSAVAEQPLLLEGIQVGPQITIGAACFPHDADNADRLVRVAQAALIEAKRRNEKSRICGPGERNEHAHGSLLNRRLNYSLASDEFMLYAQPIVNLKTYQIEGCEGLARWIVPGVGVLTPGSFLDLLAMAGLTTELTDFMIGEAIDLTLGGRFASINLTPDDLNRADLVEVVQRVLNERETVDGTPPGALWLEVLESRVDSTGHEMIDDLIHSGVQVAIDDFGAAFSSLSRLAVHEISVLKLDRELLQSLGSNARARTVVRSVVDTSHALGALVVAEGVETMEAASVVEDLDCDLVQGFLLGRPAPLPMVADLLKRPGSLTPDDWPDHDQIRAFEASAIDIILD